MAGDSGVGYAGGVLVRIGLAVVWLVSIGTVSYSLSQGCGWGLLAVAAIFNLAYLGRHGVWFWDE